MNQWVFEWPLKLIAKLLARFPSILGHFFKKNLVQALAAKGWQVCK